jgi:hypothetical protein
MPYDALDIHDEIGDGAAKEPVRYNHQRHGRK